MPGALGMDDYFGAKIISLDPHASAGGGASHGGVVILFDKDSGGVVCIADAGAITSIRTASATAAATDILANIDASRLALLGTGEQAHAHAHALSKIRQLNDIVMWGRSLDRATQLANTLRRELNIPVRAVKEVKAAVAEADIICTLTGASTPILEGAWVKPGAHVNVVGSSFAGPTEVDHEMVVRARYIADSREHVLSQGAEYLHALKAGLVTERHIVAEIGEIFSDDKPGRQSAEQITLYKSLGHIVQDLAATKALYEQVRRDDRAGRA
jgi:ornithine cyclodeaminase